MTDQPTPTRANLTMITNPEHIARLYAVLSSISNGQRRAWGQGMWISVPDELIPAPGRFDNVYGEAPVSADELVGPNALEWSCGTTGCLAGHLVIRHENVATVALNQVGHAHAYTTKIGARRSFMDGGAEVIGLDTGTPEGAAAAGTLFSGGNSLLHLWVNAEILTGGAIKVPADVVFESPRVEDRTDLDMFRRDQRDDLADAIDYHCDVRR